MARVTVIVVWLGRPTTVGPVAVMDVFPPLRVTVIERLHFVFSM